MANRSNARTAGWTVALPALRQLHCLSSQTVHYRCPTPYRPRHAINYVACRLAFLALTDLPTIYGTPSSSVTAELLDKFLVFEVAVGIYRNIFKHLLHLHDPTKQP